MLLLAPAAAILAAGLAGEPLLAHWTQTFMGSAARFFMQFFPIFLLGALFGKLMEDSGSVSAIASFMAERLGPRRAVLSVALFVLAPMAEKKIIATGERNDSVHEINAGASAVASCRLESATRPAARASSTCSDLHTAKSHS